MQFSLSLAFICYLPLSAKHSQTRPGKHLRLQSALFWVSIPNATKISQNRKKAKSTPEAEFSPRHYVISVDWKRFQGKPSERANRTLQCSMQEYIWRQTQRLSSSLPCMSVLWFGFWSSNTVSIWVYMKNEFPHSAKENLDWSSGEEGCICISAGLDAGGALKSCISSWYNWHPVFHTQIHLPCQEQRGSPWPFGNAMSWRIYSLLYQFSRVMHSFLFPSLIPSPILIGPSDLQMYLLAWTIHQLSARAPRAHFVHPGQHTNHCY